MNKLQKPISPPVKVYYCFKCGEQLKSRISDKWFDVRSGDRCVNFEFYCPNSGIFNKLFDFDVQGHTVIEIAEDGTEFSGDSGM